MTEPEVVLEVSSPVVLVDEAVGGVDVVDEAVGGIPVSRDCIPKSLTLLSHRQGQGCALLCAAERERRAGRKQSTPHRREASTPRRPLRPILLAWLPVSPFGLDQSPARIFHTANTPRPLQ